MPSGTICLYSWEGALLKTHKYKSVSGRKIIMESWKDLYKKNISYSYIHIIPDAEEDNVSDKGENRRKRILNLTGFHNDSHQIHPKSDTTK